jgi:hypothetical protein
MASYTDDAVAFIRKYLGYDTPSAPPGNVYTQTPAKGKPGGVAGAVQANDAANARRAAQARRIGLMEDPADAVNETWNARDAAGPIVAATGAGAAMGLVGHVADNAKQSAGEPFVGTPKSETADEWRARTRKMSGRDEYAGSTAELANESRPAPVVAPSEDSEKAFTEKFKRPYTERENKRQAQGAGTYPKPAADPRAEAEGLMKDLTARRMAAGGEVADGAATEARIRKLMEQSNQMRNSQTPQQMQAAAAAAPQDYHAQARAMLADLNDRASRMGGTPPDMQKVLAEVRRLNALGDEQRNARTTARR